MVYRRLVGGLTEGFYTSTRLAIPIRCPTLSSPPCNPKLGIAWGILHKNKLCNLTVCVKEHKEGIRYEG
jgi:hypothetical protein